MRSMFILMSLVAVALAGCVDDAPETTNQEAPEPNTATGGDVNPVTGKSYEIDADAANDSMLDGAHTHDEWGSSDTLIMLDDSFHTEDCATAVRAAIGLVAGLQNDQEAHMGCASFRFDEGVIVPEGTASLTIEVDATDALDAGGMTLWYRNEFRPFQPYETAQEATTTFTIEMKAEEWDIPHAEETTWYFELRPSGSPAVLDGNIDVLTVASKVEGWVPILGSKHIDHWAPDADHEFISPDIMKIMNETVSFAHPSYVTTMSGGEGTNSFDLADIVPPGASMVSVIANYAGGVDNCPEGHDCWVEVALQPAKSRVYYWGQVEELTPNYGVFTWSVPDQIGPDSTYAEASTYSVWMTVRGCPNGEEPAIGGRVDGCMTGDFAQDLSAGVELDVEAWRTSVDLNAAKQRAGV